MANLSNINNKFIVSDVGHVSIGATTTTYPLTVESGGVGTVLRAGTSFVSIDSVGSAASPSLIFNGDSNTGIWRPAADTLGFSTAGSEKMRIDSSGNVLIGIASTYPQGDNTILKLYSPSVPRFYLQNTTTGSNTTDGSQIYVSGSDLYITNSESANTIFSTNSLEKMRIDSSGNVGIGVTPSTIWSSSYDALQIGLGGSVYAHNSAGNALKLGSNIVYEGTAPNYYDKYLTSSTATKYEQDAGSHIWSTAASGTAGGVVSWSEAMRIDSSGNIMMGKNSQSGNAALTVKSMAGGNTGLMLIEGDTTNDGHGLYATTDNKFVITRFTNGSYSDNFVINSSGSVGIGTTGPLSKLELGPNGSLGANTVNKKVTLNVDGGYATTGVGSTGQYKVIGFVGTTRDVTDITGQTSGEVQKNFYLGTIGFDYFNGNRFSFWQGGLERLTIQGYGASAGNVGINTTSPTSKLHIAKTTTWGEMSNPIINIQNNGTGGNINIPHNMGSITWKSGSVSTAEIKAVRNTPASGDNVELRFSTSSAGVQGERMTINNVGNVGIGTTGPGALLHVKAPDGTIGSMILGGGNNPVTAVGQINTELNFGSNDGSAVPFGGSIKTVTEFSNGAFVGMAFYTCQQGRSPTLAEAMRITNAGSLIVGTATVAAANAAADNFVIKGEGAAVGLTISQASNSGTGTIFFGDVASSAAGGFRYNHNTGDMAVSFEDDITFSNNGGERMRITSAGRVGIGDTNPTLATRLVIAGSSGSGNVCDIRTGTTANTNVGAIVFRNSASAYCGQITVNGATAVTSYLSASDYRLKEDLQNFNGLDLVSNIKVYDYKWKSADERTYGVVAHELQEVLPQAVDGNKDDEQMQGVDYSKIVPILVKSIQELKAEIELLKSK